MRITPVDGGLSIHLWVSRLWTKGLARVPYKAHTIRMRMNAFERAVAGSRPAASTSPVHIAAPPVTLPGMPPAAFPGAQPAAFPAGPPVAPRAPAAPDPVATSPIVPAAAPGSPLPPPSPSPAPTIPAPTTPAMHTPPTSAPSVEHPDGGTPWWPEHVDDPVGGPSAVAAPITAPITAPVAPITPQFPPAAAPPVPPLVAPAGAPAASPPSSPAVVPPPMAAVAPSAPTGASPLVSLTVGQRAGSEGVSFVVSDALPDMVRSTTGTAGTATFRWQWLLVGEAVLMGPGPRRDVPAGILVGNLGERIHVLVIGQEGPGLVLYQVSGAGSMSVGVGDLSFSGRFRKHKERGVGLKVSADLLFKAFAVSTLSEDGSAAEEQLELFAGWLMLLLS